MAAANADAGEVSRNDFPAGFVFGVATSAYQVEGATNEDGKGDNIWDVFSRTKGNIKDGSNGEIAVDQYHRYKEDVELVAQLGFGAYRFSISWSRIFPDGFGNKVNEKGIAYYNHLIDYLLKKGIQPYATLYHWDLPYAIHEFVGGWLSEKVVCLLVFPGGCLPPGLPVAFPMQPPGFLCCSVTFPYWLLVPYAVLWHFPSVLVLAVAYFSIFFGEYFALYAEVCFARFGDRVKHWMTINEPLQTAVNGYSSGIFAPGRRDNPYKEPYIAAHYQILAHAAAVDVYRKKFKATQGGEIGLVVDCEWAEAFSDKEQDKIAVERRLDFQLGWFLDPIFYGDYPAVMRERLGDHLPQFTQREKKLLQNAIDFVGLNHYTSRLIAHAAGATKGPFYEVQELERIGNYFNKLHFFLSMDLQNTAFTVQLGRGANIQLANAVINTGSSGATIQFGSVDFPAVVARTTATPAYGTDSERLARRPHSTETSARRAHLSAPRATTAQNPRGRISVFDRLSQSEAPTIKRSMTGGRISVVTTNTTTLPAGVSVPRKNNIEASSSGERLTRRQRRKMNAELRAQQMMPVHPSNQPALEPEANIPIRNKFADLRWVRRNSSSGELKKSFWDRQPGVLAPPPKKKEPESLSARVYRVLKTVKEKGLKKKGVQRPLMIEAKRTPPRERLSFAKMNRNRRQQQAPRGEHRGVTPEHRVQGSAAERSRQKGKQIWRPKPHRDEEKERKREIDLGVTSGVASRRSAPNIQDRRRWVQKKTHDDTRYDGRHPGESSRGSRRSPTSPKEEVNFDRSPRVEEVLLPNQEPEIQWRRRSETRMLEEEEEDQQDEDEEEMDDAINMEVVYMLRHTNINDEAYYDEGEDDENRQPPVRRVYRRQREVGSTVDGGDRSQGEQEADEVEENHSDDENITLANIRRQMRRQMRAKDREISQLNEKMTEMMAQMGAMMQMMQRTAAVGPIPNLHTDPPNLRMPQVSGVRGAPEGGHETHNVTRQPTPQNIASTSEPVTAAQESARVVTSSSVPPDDERKDDKKSVQEEQWETAVSKKTTKMLKQLEGVPGVKWKSPIEPVLNLKGLPKVQASSSKQHPNQASSSKPKKVKSSKKKTKLKKPREKKTVTQRVIDSLDEYYQTVRQPIKLADFMSGLKVGETEENADADSLPTEVCRVIPVMPNVLVNEECVKEAVVETCMMVLPMDCSSEEDLYFPEEDESDPDLASQMEHEREKKQVGRKKASPTLPKAAIIPKERKHIPHLGSDTEEDDVTPAKSRRVRQPSAKRRKEVEYANFDYDYESIFMNTVQCVFSRRIDSLSVSDSVLVVTRVPLQYFKEIIPREVHKVEELTTRYLPPLEKGTEPGNILYSVGIHEEENRDWCYKFVDSEELFPTRLPRFNTRGVQGMLRKQVNIPTSKRQLRTCLSLCLKLKVRKGVKGRIQHAQIWPDRWQLCLLNKPQERP
ncbi:hypothetical protein M5K25_028135 [Dendrobium thyrsiflorum]|uniref:Beta-glucosidase n=1 Tax=Dendrobium thyrsiflorum TaxID=117978 RepID=A0ABD0TVM2_DENTH